MAVLDDAWKEFCEAINFSIDNEEAKLAYCAGVVKGLIGGRSCHDECKNEWEAQMFAESMTNIHMHKLKNVGASNDS